MLLDLIGRVDRSLVAALSIRLASSRAKSVIRMSGGISLAAFMRLASAATHAAAPGSYLRSRPLDSSARR